MRENKGNLKVREKEGDLKVKHKKVASINTKQDLMWRGNKEKKAIKTNANHIWCEGEKVVKDLNKTRWSQVKEREAKQGCKS